MHNERLFSIPREYSNQSETSALNEIQGAEISLQSTGDILKGELNNNYILRDSEGKLYVWRIPKENPTVLSEIQDELTQTGFLTSGGSYRFRSIPEQIDFMNSTSQARLKTPPVLFTDGHGILIPFIQGIPFDVYLRQANLVATARVLDNMYSAHRMGIVFGDRWVKNTIVTPDEDIVEVDFDIALEGSYVKEFEIAQTLYHMIHFSLNRLAMIAYLHHYFSQTKIMADYNSSAVYLFLKKYSEYFKDREYEGIGGDIRKEISELTLYL